MADQEKEKMDQQPPLEGEQETAPEAAGSEAAEAAAAQDAPAAAPDAPESPETPEAPDELEKLREENQALEERNLRLMAEFGNFKNRTAKEKDNIYGDAVANTLRDLLPVLDNLQRALESPCSDEEYKKGVELIHKGLWEVMANMGVEEIAEVGVDFDPAIHNAVMHIQDDSLGKNTVAQVLQKGYRIGDRILRYAMVQAAN